MQDSETSQAMTLYFPNNCNWWKSLQVEVALSGVEVKEEDAKPDPAATSMKVLPPWMIKQGMNLTKEQRGEGKQEMKDNSSGPAGLRDDKKAAVDEKEDEKKIQASGGN